MVVIDIPMPMKCSECTLYCEYYKCCVIGSQGIPNRYKLDELTERPEWCPIKEEQT